MFEVGDVVELDYDVQNITGALADPGALTLTVTLPDQTTAAPVVTKVDVGVYQCLFPATLPGRYIARWLGTGANAFSYTDTFNVSDPAAGGLISLASLKTYLSMSSASRDDELQTLIASVTKTIEHYVGPIIPTLRDEWYDGGQPTIMLLHNPVLSIQQVTETWAASAVYTLTNQPLDGSVSMNNYGYTINLDTGKLTRRSNGVAALFAGGVDNVHVQYTAGRTVVDAGLQQAALDLCRINWQPRAGGNRVNSNSQVDAQNGVQLFGLFVPERVIRQLVNFQHTWGIA